MPIARFQNVQFSYNQNRPVFKEMTLDIEEGKFYFLTGSSGSGKSTFLKMLHLSLQPSLGTLSVFDKDIKNITSKERAILRQRIGYVFQDFKLLPHLTVLENIILPLHVRGHNSNEMRSYGMELMKWLSLEGYENQHPDALSGGQQQRIAIGRAIITRPALILADEPTGNIDETGGRNIISILQDLNILGTTVIMATHNTTYTRENTHPTLHIADHRITYQTAEKTKSTRDKKYA